MATKTTKTVRVTGISEETEFLSLAIRLSGAQRTAVAPGSNIRQPGISLARQSGSKTGTITLQSKNAKKKVLKNTTWRFDDVFDGITVLSAPEEPDLDICAIHGLNGNGFQTWATKDTDIMWLRDILPGITPFDRARIMTFGYNSQLIDRGNNSGMTEWVHDLLTAVSHERRSEEERKRPIIFVCHSMGGIVARQAMVRLDQYGEKQEYQGVSLTRCALLFLSTPHSGSTQADWNGFVQATTKLFGVRSQMTEILMSFNPQSAEGQEDFANMKIKPPFDGFYETHKTQVVTVHRQIVTRQSASLNGKIASPLQGTDHHTICRFNDKYGAFASVAAKLSELKGLLNIQRQTLAVDIDKPWHSPPSSPNIFQPPGKKFFLGQGLNRKSNLKGRQLELNSINDVIGSLQNENQMSVAISGIGGIGKTITLLEFAQQQKNQRHIFFVHPKDGNATCLNAAFCHLARHVGQEYLLKGPPGRDLLAIWNNQSQEEKIERFKMWLGEPENDQALLLVDDLDSIRDLDLRSSAIPCEAKNVLFTTRNPVYREDNSRSRYPVRIPPMPLDDILMIMEDVRDKERSDFDTDIDLKNKETLHSIARAVHGHPLAAANAIKYSIRISSLVDEKSAGQDFVTMFEGPDFQARKLFLDWKDDGPSILETFLVSQSRLTEPKGRAWTLMTFISMLETEEDGVDYRNFFFSNTFQLDPDEYPDHALLGASKYEILEQLSEIQSVSFGERFNPSKPFRFHPLWLECARHVMHSAGRSRVIAQVLSRSVRVLAEATSGEESAARKIFQQFLPHIRHCLKICKSFKIKVADLKLSFQIQQYVNMEDPKLAFVESALEAFKEFSGAVTAE